MILLRISAKAFLSFSLKVSIPIMYKRYTNVYKKQAHRDMIMR